MAWKFGRARMGNGNSGGAGPALPGGDGPPECAELRAAYDKCFDHWYRKFQGGKWSSAEVCTDEFEDYRECYVECMQKRIRERQDKA